MKRYGKVTKSLMAGILVGVTLVGCGSSGTNAPKDSQSEKVDVAEGGSSGEKRTLEFWESSFNTELAYLKEQLGFLKNSILKQNLLLVQKAARSSKLMH